MEDILILSILLIATICIPMLVLLYALRSESRTKNNVSSENISIEKKLDRIIELLEKDK